VADQTIKFILEAVDNASAKISEVSNAISKQSLSLTDLTSALKIYGPALGAVVAGAYAAFNAFADEEEQITKATRAITKSTEEFKNTRPQIEKTVSALEEYGISSERTTEAITLLVTKAGMDMPTALQKAGDFTAWADARNISLARAVRLVTGEEKLNQTEINKKSSALADANSELQKYSDKLEALIPVNADTTSQTRNLRDLNIQLARAQENLAQAVKKYGENSTQAHAARERIADIETRISDTTSDLNAKLADAATKNSEITAKSEEYRQKIEELKPTVKQLEDELDNLNKKAEQETNSFDGALQRLKETETQKDKLAQTTERLGNRIEDIGKKLTPLAELILAFFNKVADGYDVLVTLLDVFGWYFDQGVQNILNGADLIKWAIQDMIATIQKGLTDLIAGIQKFIENIKSEFAKLIKQGYDWGAQLVQNILDGIAEKAKELADAAGKAAQAAWDILSGGVTTGATGLVATGVRPLASGGIITQPTMALLGEGGENEYVIPESKMRAWMGGKGANVTIYISEQKNARLLAGEISSQLMGIMGASNANAMVSSKT